MDEIKWAIKATPADVLEIRQTRIEGDRGAAGLFVLHSAWILIKSTPGYSTRVKIKTLRALADAVTVKTQWQTTAAA